MAILSAEMTNNQLHNVGLPLSALMTAEQQYEASIDVISTANIFLAQHNMPVAVIVSSNIHNVDPCKDGKAVIYIGEGNFMQNMTASFENAVTNAKFLIQPLPDQCIEMVSTSAL